MHKLIVVGSGIKSIAHLSEETKKVIQNSDKVLYLVNEDNLKEWLQASAKDAESLDKIYFSSPKRIDAYRAITDHIVKTYSEVTNLCVVFYGHPTVFADSALDAVKQIKEQGGNAVVLPAISAQDCLYSDLEIDPGNQGCFSIEATELVLFERNIDIYSHVLLWQVANFGRVDTNKSNKLSVLIDYLCSFYQPDKLLCLYEAPSLPTQPARIEWIKLINLNSSELNATTTIYIPPLNQKIINIESLKKLGLSLDDFCGLDVDNSEKISKQRSDK